MCKFLSCHTSIPRICSFDPFSLIELWQGINKPDGHSEFQPSYEIEWAVFRLLLQEDTYFLYDVEVDHHVMVLVNGSSLEEGAGPDRRERQGLKTLPDERAPRATLQMRDKEVHWMDSHHCLGGGCCAAQG